MKTFISFRFSLICAPNCKIWVEMLAAAWLLIVLAGCTKAEPARYCYREGETASYRFWMSQQVEAEGDRERATRVIIHMPMQIKVGRVDPNGTADLEISFRDARAVMITQQDRRPFKAFNALRVVFALRQEPDGRIAELTAPSTATAGVEPTVESLKRSIREVLPTLPARLSRGTAWSRRVEVSENIPPFGKIPSVTETVFEVGEPKTINGLRSVALSARFNIDIGDDIPRLPGGAAPQAAPGETSKDGKPGEKDGRSQPGAEPGDGDLRFAFKGRGTGSGTIYFGTETGQMVAAKYDTVVTATTRTLRGGREERSVQVIRSHIEIQPLDDAGKLEGE